MKFGTIALEAAEGTILAHSVRTADGAVKKGTRLGAEEIARLATGGVSSIMVAELEDGDVGEDHVASRIASAIAGDGVRVADAFTGRANLFAQADGIATLNSGALNELNLVDPAITIATLPPFTRVAARQMVATVKIIPFAVPQDVVARAEAVAERTRPRVAVQPFQERRVHLVLTRFVHDKDSVLEKRKRAVVERVTSLGGSVAGIQMCAHDVADLAETLRVLSPGPDDIVLMFGTSAILDRRDVVPVSLEQAGGTVEHLGMPVDPGNLLMLGRLGSSLVIGVPSCASAPKVNGFDWVLERAFAGLPLNGSVVAGMGVGGLLGEIATRPQPRRHAQLSSSAAPNENVAAVVLAAGRSTRMGDRFKLCEELAGKPLVRYSVEAALASRARPVIVVTGHRSDEVRAALDDLDVTLVHNSDYHDGLSTSLKAGIDALGAECGAAVIMLADMPDVSSEIVDRLITSFESGDDGTVCVPTADSKRGNPVLWGARFFTRLRAIKGDTGARHLLGEYASDVVEVAVDEPSIFLDVDTKDALERLRKR
ncbi:MAG: molybdopterin-binding/glycosyltransferase family 2 protein [Rhodospirillales bacterium]